MNKSIYEEALEIMIDNILPREGGKVNKTKVIKALLQAQKQEKLLELYEALVIVKDDMLSYCEVVDDDYYDSKELVTSFEKQIKEKKK